MNPRVLEAFFRLPEQSLYLRFLQQLLKELLELHDRKRQTLSFPKARSMDAEEIAREKEKLAKALLEVMEFIKKEERFKLKTKLTQKNRIRYLSVCSLKVLVLALQLEVKEIERPYNGSSLLLVDQSEVPQPPIQIDPGLRSL